MKFSKLAGWVTMGWAMLGMAEAAPRLHVSTPRLKPESKIQLVLDEAVAPADRMGKVAATGWLEISPPWKGKEVWKEMNVLEWVPEEAPKMGVNYTFRLKGKHQQLDGKPVPNVDLGSWMSEGFQIDYATVLGRYDEGWSPRRPQYYLRFNAPVDAGKAAAYLEFEADGGLKMAARLSQATFGRLKSPGYLGDMWEDRFVRASGGEPAARDFSQDFAVENGLLVEPAELLPVGDNWRLVVRAGLPAAKGEAKVEERSTRHVGSVVPLRIHEVAARTLADQPRRIVVETNLDLEKRAAEESVKVEPEPKGLRREVRGNEVWFFGDFAPDSQWTVTVESTLQSKDGRVLGQPVQKVVKFRALAAELGLPSGDEAQLAAGTRKYRVQTLNVAELKVRVKRLEGEGLLRAQQGYRYYTGVGADGVELKPKHPVPYEMVTGEVLVDRVIELTNPVDTTQPLEIDWDRVLAKGEDFYTLGWPKEAKGVEPKPGMGGAFFVELVGIPKEGARVKLDEDQEEGSGEEDEEAAAKKPLVQALVQLTDLGLAWKIVEGEAKVLVYSYLTGQPLEGVKLRVYGEDAKALREVETGADGLATLPRDEGARHLEALTEKDRHVVVFDQSMATVGLWRFPVRYSWEQQAPNHRRVLIYTERPVYRPGETVYVKGVARRQVGNEVVADRGGATRLVVRDPAGRELLEREVKLNDLGGWDVSFELPQSGSVGSYQLRFEYTDELAKLEESEDWRERSRIQSEAVFSHFIQVLEFRRNAYEVKQEVAKPENGSTKLEVDLAASYYQGQPVAEGEVHHYTNVMGVNFYPERFRDYLFGDHRTPDFGYWYHYFGYRWDDDYGSGSNHDLSGELKLDESGKGRFEIELPAGDFPRRRQVTVTTVVKDANQQSITERSDVEVHPADCYVGVSRVDRLVRVGDRLPLKLVAVTPEGLPFEGELTLAAKWSREVNEQVRVEDGQGNGGVRNEARREELSTTEVTLRHGAPTEFLFAPAQPGEHQLELSGKDAKGRPVATVVTMHVYGGDQFPWAYEDNVRIKLVPEKKLYQAGERARVLVLSPIEGKALVTVEREKVLRTMMVDLRADRPVIELPVGEEDAPNVFVSVLVIKGAADSKREFREPQLRLGYCELMIEPASKRLEVAVKGPEEVRPGDEAEWEGTVKLPGGEPAAGAEVTFYAVDEGTLAVTGYETPDPISYFYDPRELSVECGTSLDRLLPESPEEQTFFNKGFFIGGGDGGDGPDALVLRTKFQPCAGWEPALRTDAAGKFRVKWKMPDTLTRYRVMAVVHHGLDRFGSHESALVVNKELMLEPQVPRFAYEGDRLKVRAQVQNASEVDGRWKVSFVANPESSEPVTVLADGGSEVEVELKAGASAEVVFPVEFRSTGEAVFEWKAVPVSLQGREPTAAEVAALGDRMEGRFPVHYPMPTLRQEKVVRLGATPVNLLKDLDPKLVKGRGELRVEPSPSLLAEGLGAVEFLLSYPYGCVEQTSSALIPWIAAKSMKPMVPALAKVSEAQIQKSLQGGVDRLLSMQQRDGGFTYWPGEGESLPWASGYVGLVLTLAAESGAEVPQTSLTRMADYLERSLAGLGELDDAWKLETAARDLWVLTLHERQVDAYLNLMRERAGKMTPAARYFMALALRQNGDEDAALVMLDEEGATISADGHFMPYRADRALELLARAMVQPETDDVILAFDRLLKDRSPYGNWRTTWVNGWALMAMSVLAESEEVEGVKEVVVYEGQNEKKLKVGGEDSGDISQVYTLGAHLESALPLSVRGDKGTYVRVSLESKPVRAPQQPVSKQGMEITRTYERVLPDGRTEPLGKAKLGDLVRVQLEVKLPKDAMQYLAVEDPMPAIFEAIQPELETQGAGGVKFETLGLSDTWVSHRELRSDRALFFFDRTRAAGTHTLRYLARVTMEGEVTAPPAKVESMYDPERYALSASREFP